jgi:hypothetical protein
MTPRYSVYVVSKSRYESRLTSRALDEIRVPYWIVIEPQERDAYASVIDSSKILVLPFSNLGQGSIPARNWIWEHSLQRGEKRHWILDDNIRCFRRLNHHLREKVTDGSTFALAEDFVDRYHNVALAGMQYTYFAKQGSLQKAWDKPFVLNTRIYSCILILNSLTYRWRGRYNEDTDLSLCVLKDGWVTVLFYAFLCDKQATMSMRGGNTDELYRKDYDFDGRLEMAKALQRHHPDVVKVTRKWGRWQHQVDYRPFANNRLIRVNKG